MGHRQHGFPTTPIGQHGSPTTCTQQHEPDTAGHRQHGPTRVMDNTDQTTGCRQQESPRAGGPDPVQGVPAAAAATLALPDATRPGAVPVSLHPASRAPRRLSLSAELARGISDDLPRPHPAPAAHPNMCKNTDTQEKAAACAGGAHWPSVRGRGRGRGQRGAVLGRAPPTRDASFSGHHH